MKPPMTDNIESLIEDFLSEGHHVTLVVEITDRKDPDEKYVAFISNRNDKYDIILDREGEWLLRTFGPSFNSAVNKLNDRCA